MRRVAFRPTLAPFDRIGFRHPATTANGIRCDSATAFCGHVSTLRIGPLPLQCCFRCIALARGTEVKFLFQAEVAPRWIAPFAA